MEADKGKDVDFVDEDKEQAEIQAAARKWDDIMRSRIDLMRRLGQPVRLFYPNNPVDPRILLNRESNCDKIDTGAGQLEVALASALAGGGTCSSEDNNQ
ncbi:uncharacterized protein [Triticum aestivum]|uniref:uncharacterized protein isoform X2 n=1 Tax=Triticum aestivum TaxID=4565 RepID=UPI001D0072EF|nr:uncharacterized protein LOC123115496 isoform X2 [Triticum aestivum]